MENKKNYLIGIAGRKNSGKDTIASMINYIFTKGITSANYADYLKNNIKMRDKLENKSVHFADNLKQCISIIYNIDRNKLDDRDIKDNQYYNLVANSFIDNKDVEKNKLYAVISTNSLKTYKLSVCIENIINTKHIPVIKIRTLLQYFGTDICRDYFGDNIWIKSTSTIADNIMNIYGYCIIPDVRFKNEASIFIKTKSLYGVLVKVNRGQEQLTCTDTEHISEEIDFKCDFEIDNNGTLMQLFYKVLDICIKIKNV